MIDWFKEGNVPSTNAGIHELYRQRAEDLHRGQMPGPPVACARRAASVISSCFPVSTRTVATDGTVEMTESDAAPVLNAGWVRVDASDQTSAVSVV
jgi:hypothetical protein